MELSTEIKELITKDAESLYDHLNEKAQEVDCYDFGLPMSDRQTKPIIDYLTRYAETWQEAQQLVERYEKALKEIASGKVLPHMIARLALTPKTGSDE